MPNPIGPTAPGTQPASQPQGTAAPAATPPTPAAAPTPPPPGGASTFQPAAGQPNAVNLNPAQPAAPAPPVAQQAPILGFNGKTVADTNAVQNLLTRVQKYNAGVTRWGSGGFTGISATPLPDGFRLKLDLHTQKPSEKVTLMLWGEVYDPDKKALVPVLFDFLQHSEPVSTSGTDGTKLFDVRYADLNRLLQQLTQNPNLKVEPGVTPLFVAAQWPDFGHRAGGPGEGTFIAPAPSSASPEALWSAGRVSASSASVNAEDIPIDKSFKVGKAFLEPSYSLGDLNWSPVKDAINPEGEFSSRVEGEAKAVLRSKAEWLSATQSLYEMSADPVKLEKALGKGWTLVAGHQNPKTERFYVKDDPANATLPGVSGTGIHAGLRVDSQTGLPLVECYDDRYGDDANMSLTRAGHSARIRSDEHKTELQIKHGGDRPTQGLLRIRPEYAVPLKQGVTLAKAAEALGLINTPPPAGRFYHTAYNTVCRELAQGGVDLATALKDMKDLFQVSQSRHKFQLKNSEGMEIEVSLDEVTATTLRPEHNGPDGKPRSVTFYVMEEEVDHKQINSSNSLESPAAAAATNAPLDEATQKAVLAGLGPKATLNVEPSLHTRAEWANPGLRATATFSAADKATSALAQAILPQGSFAVGDPKPLEAARLLNLA